MGVWEMLMAGEARRSGLRSAYSALAEEPAADTGHARGEAGFAVVGAADLGLACGDRTGGRGGLSVKGRSFSPKTMGGRKPT